MALYDIPAKKPVFAYTDSHSSASKDSLLHQVSARRVLHITDLVITNTHATSDATVVLKYATAASSASASTVMKVAVSAKTTKDLRLSNPVKVPYGTGNNLYVNTNLASAVVGVTMTGYEQ